MLKDTSLGIWLMVVITSCFDAWVSFRILNSKIPNISDAAYERRIFGDVVSSKTQKWTLRVLGRGLCCPFMIKKHKKCLGSTVV